jgi:hypothetical protein
VVDDEASGVAEAFRAEPRPVAVSRQDKQVNSLGDSVDDLSFGAPAALEGLGITPPEALGGRGKDRLACFVLCALEADGLAIAR